MTLARIALVQNHATTDFSDLEGDLDAAPAAAEPEKSFLQMSVDLARRSPASTMPCPRCRATGRAFGGVCFRCGGKKVVAALSAAPANVRARERAAERKEAERKTAVDARNAWIAAHSDVITWIYDRLPHSNFAGSLVHRFENGDVLSIGQVAAVRTILAENADRAAARAASAPNVAGAGFAKLLEGFKRAAAAGLKRPKMTCGEFVFKLATAVSKNPGFVYVYRGTEYKGKIAPDGKLFAARETRAQEVAEIERVGRDPFAAAVAHGKLTGHCSICSRKLTDPKSVAAGIGPICSAGFGW